MHSLSAFFLAACLPFVLFAQPSFIASLYPPQHGLNIPADAELRVSLQAPLDPASLSDSSIYVWSDITGLHRLTVTLENGNRDLRIVPRHWRLNDRPPFNAGERVTVTLTTRLRYAEGRQFEGFTWHYTVAVRQNHGGEFKVEALFGGGGSTYFYVSDFNGDGWCDLVGNDDGVRRKMIVYLNDQRGRLIYQSITNIGPGRGEVTDFDKDGDQDIFFGFQQAVLNDGQANFIQENYLDWPNGDGKAHDFNNDGIMDYAIGWVVTDTLHFGVSENGLAFTKRFRTISPMRPEFYYAGISYDLNNDGCVDLIYSGVRHPSPWGFASLQRIHMNDAQISQFLETQFQIFNFYGNDFDSDGYIDYIMVGGGSGRNIQYMNDGMGMLMPNGLQTDNARLRESVVGGDFDGDGDIDLAFANSNFIKAMPETYAPDVYIYSSDGSGNFSLTSRILLPFDRPLSNMLSATDLDGDGDLDLLGVTHGLFYVVANGSYATNVSAPEINGSPSHFSLTPSYPNPFTNLTRIKVNLMHKKPREVLVRIVDISGRTVRAWRLAEKRNSVEIFWDGRNQHFEPVPAGLYFWNVRSDRANMSQKLLLLR